MREGNLNRRVRPEAYGLLCFGVMCLGFVFVKIAGFAPGVIAPDLIREFGLDATEMGLLGALYLWGYAAIQIPTGIMADTLGPRRTAGLFMLVAAAGTLLFGMAIAYQMSAVGRALMGIGTGVLFVSNAKMLAQWFPTNRFATLQGILLMVGNFGVLASAAPLAALVEALGWRLSFILLSGLAALVAVLIFVLVRDKPGDVAGSAVAASAELDGMDSAPKIALGDAARLVLLNRNLWLLAVYAFVLYGALMAIQGLWAVPYLMDVYGLLRQDASNVITMWPLGTILASPVWGYLSDRVLRTRKWVVFGGVVSFSLPFVALVLSPAGLPLWSLYGLFFFCGVTNSAVAVSFALLNDVIPRQIVGTAVGLYNVWFFVGGAVYQQAAGAILDRFAVNGHATVDGYRAVFLVCLIGAWIGALAILAARERGTMAAIAVD
ncbi:MAG: MFS transporter [Chloroflexota bacterium]